MTAADQQPASGMNRRDGPIETRSLYFIQRHRLLVGVNRLLVAVSGGPDSLCLLHVLAGLREELDLDLHVAHLDHQLRGTESEADADYVRQVATQLGLPLTVESRDVQAYRAKRRISLEEAAREVRYAFLAETAESTGAQAVAVGHTRDDNVETILMHIIRGTGTRGLRGLLPLNDLCTTSGSLRVVRPLLETSRQETAAYCTEHRLSPRTDQTNQSLYPFRNRVRLELLPLLRKYNPQIEEALSRSARMAGEELAWLDEAAERIWGEVAWKEGELVVLRKQPLLALARAMKRHILRRAIGEFVGDLKDIEARHIDELLDGIESPSGSTFQLPAGLIFVVESDRYLLGLDTDSLCPFPVLEGEFPLKVPGETVASGWKVTASVMPQTVPAVYRPEDRARDGAIRASSEISLTACLDFRSVGSRLAFRAARPGDCFEPLGLGASKKVGRFMLDASIPRSWRKRVPVLVTPEQVAWVVGWRIDQRLRVTERTKAVLRLNFVRL